MKFRRDRQFHPLPPEQAPLTPAAEPDPVYDDEPGPQPPPARRGFGCGWTLLLVLLLIAGLSGGGWWGVQEALRRGWLQQARRSYREVSLTPGALIRPAAPEAEIQIYYVVRDRTLDYRTYKLRRPPEGDAERLDLIREALNDPPDPGRFRSPLPPGATIRAAYILDGIVWVDLSREFLEPENPTPLGERLTLYAIVNTFLLNAPDLQGVRFLVEGEPVNTAWGWMDLSTPLALNLARIG